MCRRVYYIVQSKQFEFFIMGIIIANSALMATSFYGRPEVMTHVVEALNYAFTCIYVMELLLKVSQEDGLAVVLQSTCLACTCCATTVLYLSNCKHTFDACLYEQLCACVTTGCWAGLD